MARETQRLDMPCRTMKKSIRKFDIKGCPTTQVHVTRIQTLQRSGFCLQYKLSDWRGMLFNVQIYIVITAVKGSSSLTQTVMSDQLEIKVHKEMQTWYSARMVKILSTARESDHSECTLISLPAILSWIRSMLPRRIQQYSISRLGGHLLPILKTMAHSVRYDWCLRILLLREVSVFTLSIICSKGFPLRDRALCNTPGHRPDFLIVYWCPLSHISDPAWRFYQLSPFSSFHYHVP